jgi:deoxyribonuclease-4
MQLRIGIHLGTAGGAWKAVQRATEIGANTFQIFSSSPRMWRAPDVTPDQAEKMRAMRSKFDVGPLVIHASYLVNVCSQNEEVRQKSTSAFRGEVERALALGAEYLVLHPGSWKGLTREDGLRLATETIATAVDGLPWQEAPFQILIENTAGAEFYLGGSLEQVAELVERLRAQAPVAVCLDTCHTYVAGYDLRSEAGYEETIKLVESTIGTAKVKVWHCNDAKAALGSKLDRHEHIGAGTLGSEPFGRLLHDASFAHCAFIAETPMDEPDDDLRNVRMLRSLASEA